MAFRYLIVFSGMLLLNEAALFGSATDSLGVVRSNGETFVRHRVEQGETWYAIARKYGITFVELKMANRDASDLLKTGQIIVVPPRSKPTDPRNLKNYTDTEEVSNSKRIPADGRHTVKSGETVYSIARTYGVGVDDIFKWNGLSSKAVISAGQVIMLRKPASSSTPDTSEKPKQPVKPKPDRPAQSASRKSEPLDATSSDNEIATPLPGYVFSGGRKQVSEKGLATYISDEEMSTNKYYALHRTAPVGTIIKVTNRLNSKSVFVKVVGALPELGENEGVILKISKSGADQLGVREQRFIVELLYGISSQ